MNIRVDHLVHNGLQKAPESQSAAPKSGTDVAASSDLPLSSGQRSIWFVQQANPRSPCFNLICSLTLRGPVDLAALGRSLRRLWESRPILRAVFNDDHGEPTQQVRSPDGWHVQLEDAISYDDEQWRRRWDELSDAPFDLRRGPLFRATILQRDVECCVVHLAVHHIVADFWSIPLMIRALVDLYRADCDGVSRPTRDTGTEYFEFARRQRTWLAGAEAAEHTEYWRNHLHEADTLLDLPTDRPAPARRPTDGAAYWQSLDPHVVAKLRECAKREGVTPYVFCLAAFYAFLHRHTGQSELVVATPTLGRSEARWAEVLGDFANPLALRAHCDAEVSFRDLLHQVRDAVRNGLLHGDLPFGEVVEAAAPQRTTGRPLLAQVMLAWERVQQFDNAQLDRYSDGPTTVDVDDFDLQVEIDVEQRGAPFELTLQIHEQLGALRTRWQYATALFDEATIRRFAERYAVLLAAVADRPETTIGSLPLISAEERAVLSSFEAGTPRDYEKNACLHDFIARTAQAAPGDTALRFRDEVVTYGELHERAARVAALLAARGIGPDGIVGVAMTRSTDLVVAMLGILQAGGAYLPLDPEGPHDRAAFQATDAGAKIVITQGAHAAAWGEPFQVLVLDDAAAVETFAAAAPPAPLRAARPENLAYVLFTSGSTGRPKGVMIEHRAIVNRLLWMQEAYGLTKHDRVLQKTPTTFDVSVWEFFWPLMIGAELVLAEPGKHRDPAYLAQLMVERGITTLHFVPTMLRAFLDQPELPQFPALKRVFASGEALTPDVVESFHRRCGAELHNLYGPTEAAVDVTYFACRRDEPAPSIPIGRPIANMETLVLDERRQLQPIGVAGELYLGGVGLARGYANRPDLTAERFVPHPWRHNERLYRTGDVCRWSSAGQLEFLGRTDDQIKLAGNRIEIGEIETVLTAQHDVSQAVVVVRNSESGPRLAAYVVPAVGQIIDATELRRRLAAKLPAYMIPSAIVSLAEFPATSSGKIDRRALPEPIRVRDDSRTPYAAPRSQTERQLAELFAEVLEIDRIGVDDNFFDLGGASNQALEIIRRANEKGFPITAELVFNHPTIGDLAEALIAPTPPTGNTVVESLGVYLPPKVMTSEEIMAGTVRPVTFPLRRLTGIRSLRVAGETEFSYDLASHAVRECLRRSQVAPADVDAVICCNISRYDGPDLAFTFEPSTAVRLCAEFGFRHAASFDVSNACAGMFTGMLLADDLLKSGVMRNVMVVSGEYISHLAETARRTIETNFDSRLPCLTVGDAGAAIMMTATNDRQAGLHHLDLCTHAEHSRLCIAKLTPEGPIMYTDMLGVSSVISRQGIDHWVRTTQSRGWSLETVQHVIPHQVSEMTIANGFSELRKRSRIDVPEGVVISNVAERGNTATTSHWVAVWDHIRSGRIRAGDNVVFGVSGSGITVGTALYKFDELPNRVRREPTSAAPSLNGKTATPRRPRRLLDTRLRRVAVVGCGTAQPEPGASPTALDLAAIAARAALQQSGRADADVELMIYAGVYRDEYLTEPAMAALLAEQMGLHPPSADGVHPSFFAFDLLNGRIGFLQACYTAVQRMRAEAVETSVVVTAEVEGNATHQMGLAPSGAAFVLASGTDPRRGFGEFVFRSNLARCNDRQAVLRPSDAGARIVLSQTNDGAAHAAELLADAVDDLLELERLGGDAIHCLLLPDSAPEFIDRVKARLPWAADKIIVPPTTIAGDLLTSSTAFAWRELQARTAAEGRGVAIVATVGAGLQAACATYHF